MANYAAYAIPDANKAALKALFNDISGESGDPFSLALSGDGHFPASHWAGGRPVDAEWLGTYQNLATNPHVPENGWPLLDGTTEQEAADAVAALVIVVLTRDQIDSVVTEATRTQLYTQLGVQEVSDI